MIVWGDMIDWIETLEKRDFRILLVKIKAWVQFAIILPARQTLQWKVNIREP